ncbi:GGDEF domain-containing protein [Kineosporia sp. J2-2]|uniref:GGDEF domain-containing protein n=2 Tax=Kineosporia corallincola TaxID=2835133 RepID=A0ABS5TKE8_9ACTN|nr:GGDEF domain-containing protein [Kineosporia corallincola]
MSQTIIVGMVAVLAVTLLCLPWSRFSDSVLIWPVVPSAFLTTLGEGGFGVLDHYQPIYVLALGYAGLVLRPGRPAMLAALNLVLLGVVAGLGLQRDGLVAIVGVICCSALIGELIATATSLQHRQLADLQRLHDGLRPLLGAQTEYDAAQLVSEMSARLLDADGVVTMVPDRAPQDPTQDPAPDPTPAPAPDPGAPVLPLMGTLTGLGTWGGGSGPDALRVDLASEQSGIGVAARRRQHLFVPDAAHSPLVSPANTARFGCASVLYVPIVSGTGLAGVMVIWWTLPLPDLDRFTDQMVELLSIQAGPVLERVRQVEDLDRAATTDPLTGVLNRRAFEHGMADLADDAVLLLFDLDRFKQLNDTQGHPAGDRVLRAFAAALASSVRAGIDRVCRIGGDEFAILTRGDGQVARAVLERLAGVWTQPEGVGFSAGFAVREPGETPERLGARADAALYEEKRGRRERARV